MSAMLVRAADMTDPERFVLPPLTLNDRCDWPNCGAPALLRIVTRTGDLYACAHHYTAKADVLRPVTLHLQDERLAVPLNSDDMVELGAMNRNRGLTHIDPCRWCTRRLVNRRVAPRSAFAPWRDYFVCEHCDETAAPPMVKSSIEYVPPS